MNVIIARSPLRISLGGGGTDLPSYYKHFGSFFISAAIDKYVHVMAHEAWDQAYILKYAKLERVQHIHEIKHPIIRETLTQLKMPPNLEIGSFADIPAGTGLGSSGAFTTALLRALHAQQNKTSISPHKLAEEAFLIESEKVGDPVGKQDQYIAAYGGITAFNIDTNGDVSVSPLKLSKHAIHTLEDHLCIFFTGFSRSASTLLKEQEEQSASKSQLMLDHLHHTKALAYEAHDALTTENFHQLGELMHRHWQRKRERSTGISNSKIDALYQLALDNGAIGGKLIGAGGGGFLLFYTEQKNKLRSAFLKAGVDELRFRFAFEGTKLMH